MRAALLFITLLASPALPAADWQSAAGSTLGFRSSFQGESFEGGFGQFSARIRFDPTHLAGSRFDVRIPLDSANSKNQERDEMLLSADFFNLRKQAQARYIANRFRALGGNRYAADGVLSLNGISKPVALTFTWTGGAKPTLVGEAALKRLDFAVGVGEWKDTELLPNEVIVRTRLNLQPATAAAKPSASAARPQSQEGRDRRGIERPIQFGR